MTISRSGFAAEYFHQLWPVDPATKWMPVPPAQPDERHSIGNNQVSRIKSASKINIAPCLGYSMHASNGNVTSAFAVFDPALDLQDDAWDLYSVHGNAEDAKTRRRFEVADFA